MTYGDCWRVRLYAGFDKEERVPEHGADNTAGGSGSDGEAALDFVGVVSE